jgi:site-specific recombinase XerD
MPINLRAAKDKQGRSIPCVARDDDGGWWVVKERGGKKRRRQFANLKECQNALQNVDALFADGPPVCYDTLRDICKAYRHEDEMNNAAYKWHDSIEQRFVRDLGNPHLNRINVPMLTAWQAARLSEGLKPSSVNRMVARLKAVLELAVRDEIIERNPLQRLPMLKGVAKRLRWLNEDEEDRLQPEMVSQDFRLVQIALLSGMRAEEQFTMTRDCVRFDANILRVPKSKNGDAREIPMGKDLRQIVERQLGYGGKWLCPNRSKKNHWDPTNFTFRIFGPALGRAGVEDFTWHDLRHTFCSRLAMAGKDVVTIQYLAGHRDIRTTQRYMHLSPGHVHDSVFALDRNRDDTPDDTSESNTPYSLLPSNHS